MFILSSIVKLAKCRRSCIPAQGRNREAKKGTASIRHLNTTHGSFCYGFFCVQMPGLVEALESKITQVSAKVGKFGSGCLVSGFKRKEVSICLS